MGDTTDQQNKPPFGFLRSTFWPVYSHEASKVFAMFFLLLLILLNYAILRICKDTLMINSSVLGAETLPFIKICGVTPMAFFFTAFYIYVSPRFSRLLVFNCTIIGFSAYFLWFFYWLFPHLEVINFYESANWLQNILPSNFGAMIAIYRNWSISLFYILAELWSSVVMAYLFWEFANSVTSLTEAKRFYSIFNLSGLIAYLIAGGLINLFVRGMTDLADRGNLELVLAYVGHTILISSLIILVLFTYLWKVHGRKLQSEEKRSFQHRDKKKSLGVIEGILFIAKNRYLRCLSLMILCYGISIDLVEVVWKAQIKLAFPNTLEFLRFMANVQIFTSVASILYTILCGPMLQYLGWGMTALMTPLIMTVTSSIFYLLMFTYKLGWSTALFGSLSPLLIMVWIGLAQVALTKGSKNTLFIVTKEMAYIPLDPEEKTQGKAAIDVLCERMGRSGGAVISMVSILMMGSISRIVPFSAIFTLITCFVWLWATWSLKKQFSLKEKEQEVLESLRSIETPSVEEARYDEESDEIESLEVIDGNVAQPVA